jgi:hypothetical protein
VTEVRLHQKLYEKQAVAEAVRLYADFATIDLVEEGEHWIARVSSDDLARERLVGGELGNSALGLTLEERGGP